MAISSSDGDKVLPCARATRSQRSRNPVRLASYWSCIVQANPAIHDANVIFEGQVLLLPASCKHRFPRLAPHRRSANYPHENSQYLEGTFCFWELAARFRRLYIEVNL